MGTKKKSQQHMSAMSIACLHGLRGQKSCMQHPLGIVRIPWGLCAGREVFSVFSERTEGDT